MDEPLVCCSNCGSDIHSKVLWLRNKDLLKEVPLCGDCYESIKRCKLEENAICCDCGECDVAFH